MGGGVSRRRVGGAETRHGCYVWPCDAVQFDELCKLAADRLEEIAQESEDGDEFWDWNELRKEAEELRTRRHRPLGQ